MNRIATAIFGLLACVQFSACDDGPSQDINAIIKFDETCVSSCKTHERCGYDPSAASCEDYCHTTATFLGNLIPNSEHGDECFHRIERFEQCLSTLSCKELDAVYEEGRKPYDNKCGKRQETMDKACAPYDFSN